MSIRLSALVAHDRNRLIGLGDKLPWRMSGDLKQFKKRTVGQICIVGRKTYDSMPELTDRKFVIVSQYYNDTETNPYNESNTIIAGSIKSAIQLAKAEAAYSLDSEVFVIGGAEIYRASFPYLNRIYATEIDAAVVGTDTPAYFPQMANELWVERYEEREFLSAGLDRRNDYDAIAKIYDRIAL